MCRYAFNFYKSHFVCFSCRKGFKKIRIEDFMKQRGMDQVFERICSSARKSKLPETSKQRKVESELGCTYTEILDTYQREVGTCPQCRRMMAPMGFDFRVPPMDDCEAWKVIEALYEHGFAFRGCGCSVGYEPPVKMSGLPNFLSSHVRKTEGEKLLEVISSRSF